MNMQMKPGLWQQQTMKLAMTQELTQAITLLQYSAQELAAFLETKAVENPFIQLETPSLKALHKKERAQSGAKAADDKNWIEHIADSSYTITDYVQAQFQLKELTDKQKRILRFLLDNMDENGYMTIDSKEAAVLMGENKDEVQLVLDMIKWMEPAGIGAGSLQECLLLQVERRLDAPFLAETILRSHFIEFANKTWKPLAKKLGVELKDIQQAADFIRTLNPKPGASFGNGSSCYVQPDVAVTVSGETIEVHLYDDDLPKVIFEKEYFNELASHADKEVKRFIKEKEKDYQWLMRSLEQRQQTIQRVGLKIVEKQRRFFFDGPGSLQPLTMKDIAEELNIHESTVSRTVRGKYMQTPFGTYELKTFFPSGMAASSEEGETASSNQVKIRIQALVSAEDKRKPLSDQAICSALLKEGMAVSRRTVAKYREQLNIPSSAKRKRYE
ncbi:RNA polymerase factor sigma-54 [Domibacillus sp. DTU_2020_1001157_1_SI_ALB_TIR_016]|uniref:RNA polymerase factor sigma-54 n=1 Tax=Domibacillus sp. DTU_2020_1001157_1_SI_ALB_TIR_016 TaxID=3077789 RepID=UPI0028ED3B32|nr:RNA polymerase factor sigma-54 [Domibacillus sp. DTU_2020_1001157_1_SI_ALB_TIR_016]WNS81371.1 RNA polymerase factor sigma-54 [Domibacillus sp. DTU_2020_1001157_1_SI_ALB_TIR_016]